MRASHTTPEEALQVFEDVRARTFDLADEPLDEPPRRLAADAQRRGLGHERVWILKHGETRSW